MHILASNFKHHTYLPRNDLLEFAHEEMICWSLHMIPPHFSCPEGLHPTARQQNHGQMQNVSSSLSENQQGKGLRSRRAELCFWLLLCITSLCLAPAFPSSGRDGRRFSVVISEFPAENKALHLPDSVKAVKVASLSQWRQKQDLAAK